MMAVNSGLRADLASDNRAIYLPAISAVYAAFVLQPAFAAPFVRAEGERRPTITPRDLNFLDPANPHFRHPFALYSAGQSNTAIVPKPDMVSQRDRTATLVLGDSGGYQVSTTSGYFTPALVLQNMRWMEALADYSMVLDFPTGGIGPGKMAEHVERLNANGALDAINAVNRMGLDYNACLEQTKLNNDAFLANHAPGATAFLNVLQGRSEKESKFWYEAVKHYPFAGWAFAGHSQNRFSLLLARLLDMRDDGLLQKAEWIHVLGKSELGLGVLLTVVQRAVRRLYNPDFQISFDTASPFLQGKNQRLYTGASLDEEDWPLHSMSPTELGAEFDTHNLGDLMLRELEKQNARQERCRRVARTLVSRNLRLGDIREPDTDPETDREFKLTSDGYWLAMHHNVEALVDAHDVAHDTFFDPGFIGRSSPFAPTHDMRLIAALIDNVLKMPTPEGMALIREHRGVLDTFRAEV